MGYFLGYQENYPVSELRNVKNRMSVYASQINNIPNINIMEDNINKNISMMNGMHNDYIEVWGELFNSQPFDLFMDLVIRLNYFLNMIGYNSFIVLRSMKYNKVIIFTKDSLEDEELFNDFMSLEFND